MKTKAVRACWRLLKDREEEPWKKKRLGRLRHMTLLFAGEMSETRSVSRETLKLIQAFLNRPLTTR